MANDSYEKPIPLHLMGQSSRMHCANRDGGNAEEEATYEMPIQTRSTTSPDNYESPAEELGERNATEAGINETHFTMRTMAQSGVTQPIETQAHRSMDHMNGEFFYSCKRQLQNKSWILKMAFIFLVISTILALFIIVQDLNDRLEENQSTPASKDSKLADLISVLNSSIHSKINTLENDTETNYLFLKSEIESLQLEMSDTDMTMMIATALISKMNNSLHEAYYAPCEIKIENTCYWTEVRRVKDIDFVQGSNICRKKNSEVAQIPNQEVYSKVMENIRMKAGNNEAISAWIAMTINPLNGNITFPGPSAFTKWHPNRPHLGRDYATWQNVFLYARPNPSTGGEGMANRFGSKAQEGVVCQTLFNSQ